MFDDYKATMDYIEEQFIKGLITRHEVEMQMGKAFMVWTNKWQAGGR